MIWKYIFCRDYVDGKPVFSLIRLIKCQRSLPLDDYNVG